MSVDPEVFGGFLLVRRLAESRMASVYIAVRLADASGKPLVLKRAPFGERASGPAAQAILREAEVLGEVSGAGIPSLEGAGDIAGLPYVALERLHGVTLSELLLHTGSLPLDAVRAIGHDVGRALAKLHAAGWVHRDVTPSNVFVDDSGEAFLIDFGLCIRAHDDRGSAIAGTRGYVAPEAVSSKGAEPSRDVYGLAVCVAEAALGRRLFEDANLVDAAARGDAPAVVTALDEKLPLVVTALRRDPSARPSSLDFANAQGGDFGRSALADLVSAAQEARQSLPSRTSSGAPTSMREVPAGAAEPGAKLALAPFASTPSRTHQPSRPLAHATIAAAPLTVTPTVAMPPVAVRSSPSSGLASSRLALSREGGVANSTQSASNTLKWAAFIAFAVIAALFVGFLAGRAAGQKRGASFAISGPLPKRAELSLDGKKLTIAEGVPMNVAPGQHTFVIATTKGGKREIPFQVRPGEQVVIVPSPRGSASFAPEEE